MLKNIKIVLVSTSRPANIGAAARAMKTMMLNQLALVCPRTFPDPEADALATHAVDLLQQAQVYDSIDQAIADCQLVVGTSARHRKLSWPMVPVREAAETIFKESGGHKVAILFGPEQSGLSNEDLRKCDFHAYIPSNPEYGSINLAQSVQIMCYELLMATEHPPVLPDNNPEQVVDRDEFNYFFNELTHLLYETKVINPKQPDKLLARMRRLFLRAKLHRSESQILLGMITNLREQLNQK